MVGFDFSGIKRIARNLSHILTNGRIENGRISVPTPNGPMRRKLHEIGSLLTMGDLKKHPYWLKQPETWKAYQERKARESSQLRQ